MNNKKGFKWAAVVLSAIVLVAAMSVVFTACNDDKRELHDVIIELINPNTGEIVQYGDKIELPPEGTKIEIRLKDLMTGEYLTDEDLPETTVEDSITIGIIKYRNWDHLEEHPNTRGPQPNYWNEWPTEKGVYEFSFSFDCYPENPENPKEFKAKYDLSQGMACFELI